MINAFSEGIAIRYSSGDLSLRLLGCTQMEELEDFFLQGQEWQLMRKDDRQRKSPTDRRSVADQSRPLCGCIAANKAQRPAKPTQDLSVKMAVHR